MGRATLALTLCLFAGAASPIQAQSDFYKSPIAYDRTAPDDPIARLRARIEAGEETLEWDAKQGWLPAILERLNVPESSQTLVFSRTSLQLHKISRRTPRALYFNDEVYVGWIPRAETLELSAVDPQLGAVFYSVEQTEGERPRIVRDRGCMTCHATSNTEGVPGYLLRSVFANSEGRPIYSLGTRTTDPTADFSERYGGWYVTGTHGDLRHRGNVPAKEDPADPIDEEAGANVTDLAQFFDVATYPQPTSDIVALMTLEHQAQVHNLLTRAEYETRSAIAYDATMNEALDRPADHRSDVTTRRIRSAGDALVEGLLFSGEFRLTSPVQGNSSFAEEFSALGPRDPSGRSLRDFDLQTRLFRYPCSFLIYSPQFDGLPDDVRGYVYDRLIEVLTGGEASRAEEFAHLTPEDRDAIREILAATKPEFAERLAVALVAATSS